MFHIVFNADDKYIKFAAVVITSIIKNTNTCKKFKDFFKEMGGGTNKELTNYEQIPYNSLTQEEQKEGYVFHILNDFISKENQTKLNTLQNELSQIYPCEILIHHKDNSFLQESEIKPWPGGGFGGSYAAHYRIILDSFLPNELKTCLYLDCDMLVLSDLRELWTLSLKDKILATAFTHKDRQKEVGSAEYFNAGFMFFDLYKYREQNCAQKVLDFMMEGKAFGNQPALNTCIKDTLKLPEEYNYWLQTYRSDNYDIFAFDSFVKFKQNVKIIHYIKPKPWISFCNYFTHPRLKKVFIYQNVVDLWWNMALKTPVFSKELYELRLKTNDNFAKDIEIFLDILEFKASPSAKARIQNHLAYKLGSLMIRNSKSLFGLLKMPFLLMALTLIHKEQEKAYKAKIKTNPSLALPPLESYLDYQEALKEKECFTYKLGEAFIKAYKSWYKGGFIKFFFEAKSLYKEFKSKKTKQE